MKKDNNSLNKRSFDKNKTKHSTHSSPSRSTAKRTFRKKIDTTPETDESSSVRLPEDEGKRRFNKNQPQKKEKKVHFPSRKFLKGNAFKSEDEPVKRPRRDITAESPILSEIVEKRRREGRQPAQKVKVRSLEYEEQYIPIRLNKYIANAGICSRREADSLIAAGAIRVNGIVVTEMGYKVLPTDEVCFGEKVLQREKPVYLLLNKPKDYITTMYDEFHRKHVMQLVKGACKERIYPVGRLDRDTTGLLLFTNDGEMTKKLTHPRSGIRKIYHVTLDKNLKLSDLEHIANGLTLEDGEMKVDEIAYVGNKKNEVGITIHSGKNRIIRRIFESLGYQVEKLDRTVFAGLTKKDLPRGEWRFLTQAEINILKMSMNNKF